MMRRLTQLKAISCYEWRLLFSAMLLLPLTGLSLHLFGFKRTRTIMSRTLSADRAMGLSEVNSRKDARVVARMVAIAAKHGIYRANCLKQSTVLWWLLARRGIVSEIKIGVQKRQTGPFNAHAWVECGGRTLLDPEYIRHQFSTFEKS